MKNMPIIGRLSLGFAAMLAIACLMGGLALYNIHTLAELSDKMYRHPLTVTHNIQSVKEGILRIRHEMHNLRHAAPAEAVEIGQQVENLEIRIANNLSVIRKQYLGPADDVDAIEGMLASWRHERAEIFRLVRDGKFQEAANRLEESDASRSPPLGERIERIQNFAINRAAWFNHEANRTRQAMNGITLGLLFGLLLAGGLGARLITRSIAGQFDSLRLAMSRLAGGDLGAKAPHIELNNEVGEMARAVETFRIKEREAEALRWVRGSVADLSAAMRVAGSLEELGSLLLGKLVPLLDGVSGAFYLLRQESASLEAIAWFARPAVGDAGQLKLGEGIAGQCALENRIILLDNLPVERFSLAAGAGHVHPTAIAAMPVAWGNQVLAVIEIAAFHSLDETQMSLLEALMPAVGVNLEILGRNLRTRELLEQTQHQAEALRASEEELQAQSEELRQANELMQQQTESLRASEEELKAQSEELHSAYDELLKKAAELQDREAALEHARNVAEQRALELDLASRYKSEFLANMSHELRTPLNSMLILSQDLAANDGGNLDPDQVEAARIIHEGGSHLLSLINDILDLSKIEAGKLELSPEDIPLEDLKAMLERRFRHMAQAKGIGFAIHADAGIPEIFCADRRKVDQILNNLVGNALKFTGQGEVSVAFSRPADGLLSIAVRDTGVGIASAKLDKIFDAFEQADGSTSRRFGGTGLGLAISRRLARLMGGDIAVSSAEGQGSAFTVTLPLTAATLSPAQPPEPPAPAAQAAEPVREAAIPAPPGEEEALLLVIEDDPAFARIVCDLARKKGFQCLVAGDGEEGLALAARRQPTGIILDVGLPGRDGWSVMERLKRDPATRRIPVHFISAFDESQRGLGMGAVGYYVKPVSREQIENAFEKINLRTAHRPRTLLVLDKDDDTRKAVAELFAGDSEVSVLEAESCRDALAILQERDVDCLILDLGMPDMSELEFLEKLVREKGERAPPVVIYSDRELEEEEMLKLRAYTDSIIIKGKRSQERLLDEVTLFLHRVGSSLPVQAPSAADAESLLAGRTMLVVDDDMRNTFALAKVLRGKGLKVLMAQDGDKALAQLAANPNLDMVLTDIMMPGKDGYQTIREIRQNPAWQKLPVLALTARAMPGDREKCLHAGANDYLTKPVDIDKLLSLMRVWLQEK